MPELTGKVKIPAWIWALALGFVALNAIAIAKEFYFVPLIPVALLVIWIAFTRFDILLLATVLFVPVSLQLNYFMEDIGVNLYLPTEPMLALIMIIMLMRYLKGYRTDIRLLRHPVSLSIYFYLAWMVITIITSSNPLVSVKFFVSQIWFLAGFYLAGLEIFRKKENMKRYIWMYVITFSVVIIYTLARHSVYGLDNQMMAHSMMQPFYKDHTSYGATLAFLIPVLIALFTDIKRGDANNRFLLFLLLLFFVLATLFSYTRAAWVSLIGGLGVWVLIKLRIRIEIVALMGAIAVGLFFVFQSTIMMRLEENRTRSSGDIAEHVQSISNISNDQSNLERINRWSCAIRMWKERPVFGFGPGTYQFEYARFQRSYERTQISTDFGTRGRAHSEYLGPLAESGFPGMISILLILGTTIFTGIRVYLRAKTPTIRKLSLGLLIGLITYYIHGIMNNFLDTDKASSLFWGFTAMLVVMDVYHNRKNPEEEQDPA